MIGPKLLEIREAVTKPPWISGQIPSNVDGIDEGSTALQSTAFCQVFLWRFWKEDDLHEVHCPGCEQGAQSRQCVHTWRNKTRPINYTSIVGFFFVAYYDREINRQIKYWWKIATDDPKYLKEVYSTCRCCKDYWSGFRQTGHNLEKVVGSFFNENVPAWRIEAWYSLTQLVHFVCLQMIFFFNFLTRKVSWKEEDSGIRGHKRKERSCRNILCDEHYFTSLEKFNPLNAELNPACRLLALLRAHHILHVSRERVKATVYNQGNLFGTKKYSSYLFVPMLTDRAADLNYLTLLACSSLCYGYLYLTGVCDGHCCPQQYK